MLNYVNKSTHIYTTKYCIAGVTLPSSHVELLHLLENVLASFRPRFTEGVSEFEIISLLKQPPYQLFDEDALRDSLMLFQTHFILFHALYNLRREWRTSKVGELDIGPTSIKLHPLTNKDKNTPGNNIQNADPLADYYLDWRNLAATDQAGVEELLSSFWQKMTGKDAGYIVSQDELNKAKSALELSSIEELTLTQLKQQYRKLQHKYHPDKGGCIKQSQMIIEAYTALHKYVSSK
jgi:hypothetical protein